MRIWGIRAAILVLAMVSACGGGVIDYQPEGSSGEVTSVPSSTGGEAEGQGNFVTIKGQISVDGAASASPDESIYKFMTGWQGEDALADESEDLFTVTARLFDSAVDVGEQVLADSNGNYEIQVPVDEMGGEGVSVPLIIKGVRGGQVLMSLIKVEASVGVEVSATVDATTTTTAILTCNSIEGDVEAASGGDYECGDDPIPATVTATIDAVAIKNTFEGVLLVGSDEGFGSQVKTIETIVRQAIILRKSEQMSAVIKYIGGAVTGTVDARVASAAVEIVAMTAAAQKTSVETIASKAVTFASEFTKMSTFVKETVARKDSTVYASVAQKGAEALAPLTQSMAIASTASVFSSETAVQFYKELYTDFDAVKETLGNKNRIKSVNDFLGTAVEQKTTASSAKVAVQFLRAAATKFDVEDDTLRRGFVSDNFNVMKAAIDTVGTESMGTGPMAADIFDKATTTMNALYEARIEGSYTSTTQINYTNLFIDIRSSSTFNYSSVTINIDNYFVSTEPIYPTYTPTGTTLTGTTATSTTSTATTSTATSTATGTSTSTSTATTSTTSTATTSTYTPPPPSALTVTSQSPLPNATGVLPSSVYAVFSKDLDASTVTTNSFGLKDSLGTAMPGTVAYDAATRRVTFTPSATLSRGAVYTLRITLSLKAIDGAMLSSELVSSFTTVPVFAVATTNPLASGTVAVEGSIDVYLNNSVQASSVQAATCSLTCSSANVAGSCTLQGGDRKDIRFIPTAALTPLASCTFTLANNVIDDFGGTLAANHSFSFTVSNDTTGPSQPASFAGTVSGASVNLTWGAITDNVDICTDSLAWDNKWPRCYLFQANTSGSENYSATMWPDRTEVMRCPGTSYNNWIGWNTYKCMTLRCIDSAGNWGLASAEGCFQTPVGPPSISVNASTTYSATADITWSAASGATGYNIYRSTTSDFTPTAAHRINLAYGNATSPLTDRLGSSAVGTTYYYKSTSTHAEGESTPSGYSSFTPAVTFAKAEVSGSGSKAVYSSMVLDSNGKVHMSSINNSNGDVMYSTNTSGSLVQGTVYSTSTASNMETAITRDSSNNIYISFYDDEYTVKSPSWTNNPQDYIKVAKCTSGADCTNSANWAVTSVRSMCMTTSSTSGRGLSDIAVDSSGKVHVVFMDKTTDSVTPIIRTSAADNYWTSAAYGGGLFVAVASTGTGNRVMTSPDGITWTTRTSAADNSWNSVTYGNGLFVAVADSGTGNRVMTSPDGITWTTRTSAADNSWSSVTYGNSLFVAVADSGTGNRVMTSPDGITWTSRTSASDNSWRGVTYGNSLFVAVAYSTTNDSVMTSPDGITWTLRTSAGGNYWTSVAYGNAIFMAVSSSGTSNSATTSPDGITWTLRAPTPSNYNYWTSITYGNNAFVAVARSGTGNRVMSSPSVGSGGCSDPFVLNEVTCTSNCNLSNSWSAPTQIASLGTDSSAQRLSLVLDGSGNPHVAYTVTGGTYPNYTYAIRYAKYTTSWQASETVETNTGTMTVYFPSLALDSSGKAHVAYAYRNSGDFRAKYATNSTGSWVTSTVESSGSSYYDRGYSSSIALDSSGKAHIAYSTNYASEIKYATNKTGSWVLSTVDTYYNTSGSNSNWYVDIALDSSNDLHFGYFKYGSYSLWYTKLLPY